MKKTSVKLGERWDLCQDLPIAKDSSNWTTNAKFLDIEITLNSRWFPCVYTLAASILWLRNIEVCKIIQQMFHFNYKLLSLKQKLTFGAPCINMIKLKREYGWSDKANENISNCFEISSLRLLITGADRLYSKQREEVEIQ